MVAHARARGTFGVDRGPACHLPPTTASHTYTHRAVPIFVLCICPPGTAPELLLFVARYEDADRAPVQPHQTTPIVLVVLCICTQRIAERKPPRAPDGVVGQVQRSEGAVDAERVREPDSPLSASQPVTDCTPAN